MRRAFGKALAGAVAIVTACGPDAELASGPDVVRETIGDTVVVRTLSGSLWGGTASLEPELSIGELEGADEHLFGDVNSLAVADDGTIYALDRQALHVRVYGADGTYLRTMGHEGQGPGELTQPEAIALLPDGRLAVRDPGNQRVQVYTPDGQPDADWRVITGSHFSATPLWADEVGRSYVFGRAPDAEEGSFDAVVVVVESDGTIAESLPIPGSDYEEPRIEVVSADGRGRTRFNLPFGPGGHWAFAPDGSPVVAIATDYRIDVGSRPPLRIERTYEPVPVQASERDWFEGRIRSTARRLDPGWNWSGPRTPEHKPPFKSIWVGRDGSFWTLLSTTGIELENPNYNPDNPNSLPTRWTEPYLLDAFASDGTYLGMLEPPEGMTLAPKPVFTADQIWAVTRDDLGVQRIVRYRIVAPE